ncbi:MAG TPA: hypothetical protein PKM88_11785, partial [bacterium]|nr:hypothetical protein [bacterium]
RNRFHTMRVPSFPGAELLTFWGGRQFGFDGFEHNPVEYAASVRCPALFLHGENDPRARMEEGQHVYESVPGEKRIVIFKNAGHEPIITSYPVEWRNAVKDILIRAENAAPPRAQPAAPAGLFVRNQ